MATPGIQRQGNSLLATLCGILILADAGLAALGVLVWSGHQNGNLTGAEAAAFIVLGISATTGAVIYLLALIALARGRPGHQLARLAYGLTWLRLAGVLIALTATATAFGTSAVTGSFQAFGIAIVIAEALAALIVTSIAVRRTRRG